MAKRWRGLLPMLAAGLLASCSAEAKREISFSKTMQPVFNAKCLQCHFGGRAAFDMTRDDSYQDLHKFIKPGQAEASPLYIKIKGGHPTVNSLSPAEIEMLKQWINQGAVKN